MIKKVILLVIVIGIFVFIVTNKKSEMESRGTGGSKIYYSKMSEVGSIEISDQSNTSELMISEGKWFTKDAIFPVDTSKINKLLDLVSNLDNGEVVSRNLERASEYGIDSASRKTVMLKDKSGNSLGKFHVGKTSSADYNSTFWMEDGKEEIYRTPGNFKSQIRTKYFDWKDRKLFDFEGSDVQQMDVTWKDSTGLKTTFSVKAKAGEEGGWATVFPKEGNAKKAAIDALANRFGQLSIDKFKEENDSTAYDEEPTYDIRVTLKSGITHEIKAHKGPTHAYMKHPSRDDLVLLSNWRFGVFDKKLEDFYEPDTATSAAPDAPADPGAVMPALTP